MSTIYLVTSGEYSDFGVVCAYSTEEEAKHAVRCGVGDDYQECELDDPAYTEGKQPPNTRLFAVALEAETGQLIKIEDCMNSCEHREGVDVNTWPMKGFADHGSEWRYKCYVTVSTRHADTEQAAIKAANEKRAMALAAGELENKRTVGGLIKY